MGDFYHCRGDYVIDKGLLVCLFVRKCLKSYGWMCMKILQLRSHELSMSMWMKNSLFRPRWSYTVTKWLKCVKQNQMIISCKKSVWLLLKSLHVSCPMLFCHFIYVLIGRSQKTVCYRVTQVQYIQLIFLCYIPVAKNSPTNLYSYKVCIISNFKLNSLLWKPQGA